MRRFLWGIVITGLTSAAHAGAWVQPKGEGLAITQLTQFSSHQYWDTDSTLRPQEPYRKWELQPYAEYGLTDTLTLGGAFYAQYDTQDEEENAGIADPEIFLRQRIWHSKTRVISLQPLIKLPSRFNHNDSAPRGGSKSTDMELSLLYGQSLHLLSNRDFADMRVGIRNRSRGLHGQVKADMALGLSPWESWQFIPAIRYVGATTIDDTTPYRQTGDLDYTLLKAELAVAYQFPSGNWLQGTYFKHVEGRQTGNGDGVSLGYAVRF